MQKKTTYYKKSGIGVLLLAFQLFFSSGFPQTPERMNFQTVVRNNHNELVVNQPVGIRIQIKQGSEFGAAVYVETQTPETNSNGLVTLEIGQGRAILGSFATIDWTNGPYFIQTEVDLTGGSSYTLIGISQLVSVPYALHAITADSLIGNLNESDPAFELSVAKSITNADTAYWNNKLEHETQNLDGVLQILNDGKGMQIKNAEIPTDPGDMATKAYVDELESSIDDLENILFDAGLYVTKDAEGHVYHAVKIGSQIWMDENLRTTRYNDGTDIPYMVIEGSQYPHTAGYCWFANNVNYGDYGPLYNFYVVESGKLCPSGWHIPTDDEWDLLAAELGGIALAGGKMKDTTHWLSPNHGATNESGFKSLPGGQLGSYQSKIETGFDGFGRAAYWWSVTAVGESISAYFNNYYSTVLGQYVQNKSHAMNVRCIKGDTPEIMKKPEVTTHAVTNILQNTATCGGIITNDGGSAIIARGVCWSTSPNPDTSDMHTYDGYGPGEFISQLAGLVAIKTYYIRAYAINKTGIAYGNEQTLTTQFVYDTLTDVEGNTYKSIEIGTQTWMAENLKTTRYNNGDSIGEPLNWSGSKQGAYSNYGNDTSIAQIYGKLYNFYTIADPRGLCPTGWHVPTYNEWMMLTNYLGGENLAGGKLKETGYSHWQLIGSATNESGFTALPGGLWNGEFSELGKRANFWTSTNNIHGTWLWTIYGEYVDISKRTAAPEEGFSIRCMKD